MIPKVIHFCWFGGLKGRPALAEECIATWSKVWPDYEVKWWHESNLPDSMYAYKAIQRQKWANASNLVRFYALLEGGIYLDVDVEAVRDFGSLLQEGMFLGWQDSRYVNNAVMGAVPNHPFIKLCISEFEKRFDGTEKAMVSSPFFVTDMLREQFGELEPEKTATHGEVTLLSTDYFYAYPYQVEPSPNHVTDNTVCLHRWMKSWD